MLIRYPNNLEAKTVVLEIASVTLAFRDVSLRTWDTTPTKSYSHTPSSFVDNALA